MKLEILIEWRYLGSKNPNLCGLRKGECDTKFLHHKANARQKINFLDKFKRDDRKVVAFVF